MRKEIHRNMSVISMSNIKRYWSDINGFHEIKETMGINRFEKIREMLHFNDNSKVLPKHHEDYDR